MVYDPDWDEFVEASRRKLDAMPKQEQLFGIGNLLAGIEPPPFDDPKYIARCNRSFRADYALELKASRDRWTKIIVACLSGEYGRAVRDDWQSEYPGVNPETLADSVLMQAAQAVWKLKGSTCIEKMPTLRTMSMPRNPIPASNHVEATNQIPPTEFGYGNVPVQGSFDDLLTG